MQEREHCQAMGMSVPLGFVKGDGVLCWLSRSVVSDSV